MKHQTNDQDRGFVQVFSQQLCFSSFVPKEQEDEDEDEGEQDEPPKSGGSELSRFNHRQVW